MNTPAARAVLSTVEIPYEGAASMLLVDVEDSETIAAMVESMYSELPEPKKRKR